MFSVKRKLRIELRIGLLLFAFWAVLHQFTETPHLILGGLIGGSLCSMIIGSLREVPYNTLKAFKKNMFKKNT